MSGLRRIISNTLISLFGQLVTWSSTLMLTIAYGRFLGDIKFGELTLATTLVALVGVPVENGFNQQLIRDIAEDAEKTHKYLWNALFLKTAFWICLYVIILFIAWALGYSEEQRNLVAICGLTLFSGSIVTTFAAIHYAFERTLFPAVGLMLEKGLSACVGFIMLKQGATVQTMALILLGGSVIDVLWVAFWVFRLNGLHFALEKATIRKLMHTGIPFMIYGAVGVIYYRIDTVLLSLMASTAVVGWYGAAYRLFDTLLFIPSIILNAVMYPVFSKLSGKSQETLKLAIEKCMSFLFICSFPIATIMIGAAPNIIGFLYHRTDFANASPVLQALAPGLVFLYLNTLFCAILVTTKKEKKIPGMATAALVFNLGLNLLLIPIYQQIGAAVVTSLTELLLLCIALWLMPKHLLPGKGSLMVGLKALIAALVMALVIFFLQTFSVLVILPAALAIYGGALLLLRAIPREDMQTLYKAIKHKNKKTSTETLTPGVVDGDIHTQASESLPSALAEAPLPETTREEDEITERLPAVYRAIKYNGRGTSAETLARIIDQNNYTQIPKRLLAILAEAPLPEITIEGDEPTEHLYVVLTESPLPEITRKGDEAAEPLYVVLAESPLPEATGEEDESTEPLYVVLAESPLPETTREEDESAEPLAEAELPETIREEDESTEPLYVVLAESPLPETTREEDESAEPLAESPLPETIREEDESTEHLLAVLVESPLPETIREEDESTEHLLAVLVESPLPETIREEDESTERLLAVLVESPLPETIREEDESTERLLAVLAEAPLPETIREEDESTKRLLVVSRRKKQNRL